MIEVSVIEIMNQLDFRVFYKLLTCGCGFFGLGGTAGPIFFEGLCGNSELLIRANSANCLSKSFISVAITLN